LPIKQHANVCAAGIDGNSGLFSHQFPPICMI